jgi:putative tryptophan/tyrosine transport system substrate-binding protein
LGLAGLGMFSGCGLLPPQSQPASAGPKVPRIGVLNNSGPSSNFTEPFLRGLAELGYVEDRDIAIEWRPDEGNAESLASNAAELVALPVDVIIAAGDGRTRATIEATRTIPIVVFSGVDPVGNGLIESLDRPGGNATGAIEGHPELHGRRLQLLREIARA